LPTTSDDPSLDALRRRLEEEETAYAELLAAVDRLASFSLPAEALPDLPARVRLLNTLWEAPPPPKGSGLGGKVRRWAWDALAPALARQTEFNAVLVQILNGYLEETGRLHASLRELAAALVHYLQRVLPLVDLRDRVASALATTRAELILEAFDRRQESQARRLQGLLALRDRLETVSEEVGALRGTLRAGAPPPALAAAALCAAEDSVYTAFENRFRGSREEIRTRLADYAALFEGLAPVVDLGCGRGEFLDLLRERGIAARGVEGNASVVQHCRNRGLEVVHGDLLAFLQAEPAGTLGGVFAAQVAEHLSPAVLGQMLKEAHRALRPGGLLVLETVNPRSVVGFLEVYNRDLTHERPLHPDTLSFLAAAQGFTDLRVELRSPVDPSSRLQAIPPDGLPERAAALLNENLERLNGLLYGHLEYALIARR
jgi:O-antigen chain-terminating methyltransferase